MESVEASGKSIEDAILQALARLGRNRDEVDITVLQEPSRGTRGMGVREARVRVHVRPGRTPARAGTAATDLDGDEFEPEAEDDAEDFDDDMEDADEFEPAFANGAPQRGGRGAPFAEDEEPAATIEPLARLLPEDASIEEMAVVGLESILAHMGIPADVEVAPAESEDEPLTLNVRSDNERVLSLLIGRRGETLAALQLVLNLVVAKQSEQRERIIVDVEGYRQRREDNLRSMAQRIAQQVRRSGTPIMLEAMPPNERRIIHMALADLRDISTESTGEGDQRRVVVSLKRGAR